MSATRLSDLSYADLASTATTDLLEYTRNELDDALDNASDAASRIRRAKMALDVVIDRVVKTGLVAT